MGVDRGLKPARPPAARSRAPVAKDGAKAASVKRATAPWLDRLLAIALALAAFACYRQFDQTQLTDSRYALATAWQIWTAADSRLDPVVPELAKPGSALPYQIERSPAADAQGRRALLYWYPNFPCLLAGPALPVLAAFGHRPVDSRGLYDAAGEEAAQLRLAAALTALAVALGYLLARVWLPPVGAAALAAGFGAGSAWFSTNSRAVWSGDWGTVFLLGALWHLGRRRAAGASPNHWLAGTLCAWLYLCRPAYVVEIAVIIAFVVWHDRKVAAKVIAVAALWLAAYVGWSLQRSGELLPSYYRHAHLVFDHIGAGFYGSLAGPSRGILVWTPLAALALGWTLWRAQTIAERPWLMASWGAVFGHAALLAVYPNWWGGHSVGARLMADPLPFALVACSIAAGDAWIATARWLHKCLMAAAVAAVAMAGAWLQWRAVTSPAAFRWNSWPDNINDHPARANDWRLPQFMAGQWPVPPPDPLPFVRDGETLRLGTVAAQAYLQDGWGDAEEQFRWTDGQAATLCFQRDPAASAVAVVYAAPYLDLRPAGRGPKQQRVGIAVDGGQPQPFVLAKPGGQPLTVALPAGRADVCLRLDLPDAVVPRALGLGDDTRRLAVQVYGLRLGAAPK